MGLTRDTILFAYFSGQLTESEKPELLEWLNASEDNRKIFSEMADWWAIAHVPLFESDLKSEFKKKFEEIVNPVVLPNKNRTLYVFLGIAASLLLLLSVGAVSYLKGKQHSLLARNVVCYEMKIPLGSQSALTLPDRSVVYVNAGSSVKYQENPVSNTREIILDGEAFFEIVPDTLNPLFVKTNKLDIKVLGTSFNVKAYETDETIDVALLSGKIDVSVEMNAENLVLQPNHKLTYRKGMDETNISQIHAPDYCTWRDGCLKFMEQPFVNIARDLERMRDVKIHIESEYLKREVFSGNFTKDYSMDNVFKEIDVENKYTWIQNDNVYTIRDK